MRKIELTISPGYVPGWTIVDAVRELFQNALDQEKQHPGNDMDWSYEADSGKLYITNKSSVLTASSLLLGTTTKAGDASTIGQFGEGYKIATLVLLRNGKKITFYNYGAKEIWRPRFVQSRRFGTSILTFFIEKAGSFWSTPPNADLTIEVEGITAEEFEDILESNLHMRSDYTVIQETSIGDVVDLPGKVFVNGLYVCDYKPYKYGYNFKPEHIKLDRDRKMVSDFDLKWMASRLWCNTKRDDIVLKLLEQGADDVLYINSTWEGNVAHWRDVAAENFINTYGPNAIPVSTQEELKAVPSGYKGILVSGTYNSLIRTRYTFQEIEDPEEPKVRLRNLFKSLVDKYDIEDEDVELFNEIIEEI